MFSEPHICGCNSKCTLFEVLLSCESLIFRRYETTNRTLAIAVNFLFLFSRLSFFAAYLFNFVYETVQCRFTRLLLGAGARKMMFDLSPELDITTF